MNDAIRTLIVDDEPMSLASLRAHATADEALTIVGECGDGAAAVHAIRTLSPELVLLDIQMPLLDGFEVLARVDVEVPPVVVFVTAYDEYAVRAFDVAAADFLLKPFDAERFGVAVGRAKDRVYRGRTAGGEIEPGGLAPLAGAGASRDGSYAERLLIRENGRIYLLPVDSISWVESAANYVKIYARDRYYVVRMKISDMDNMLDPAVFARVHRTRIVNMSRIASLKPVVNGNYVIVLDDGTEMRMSRLFSHNVLGATVGRHSSRK